MSRSRIVSGGGGLNVKLENVVVVESPSSKRGKSIWRLLVVKCQAQRSLLSLLGVVLLFVSMMLLAMKGARDVSKEMRVRGEDELAAASALLSRDYSNIQAIEDLTAKGVTPCLGNRKDCKCPADTTLPTHRIGHRQWAAATHNNQDAALEAAKQSHPPDIVFYGDAIVEGWKGTSLGNINGRREGIPEIFQKLFDRQSGAKYQGLPLGVAGDTTTNLLYRIQHGEFPKSLQPKVVWVLIASDDLFINFCSAEMALIGILRVLLELKQQIDSHNVPANKNATTTNTSIVINAILPRTYNQHGYVMKGGPRLKKRKNSPYVPSLYSHIVAINEQLERYANNNDDVYYFESNSFWIDHDAPDEMLQIDPTYMPDYSHPSVQGYELWGKEIIKRLDGIISSPP